MFAVTKNERKEHRMAVNARTEKFQHIEVFDKPALFTNGRIARDTVPKGWYCYDIRGSDDDPGELCYMLQWPRYAERYGSVVTMSLLDFFSFCIERTAKV